MTQQQLKTLLVKLQADEGLMTAINQAKSTQAIVEIAKSKGFEIELQDLYDNADKFVSVPNSLELSPEELEAVSGGAKKKGTPENPWTTKEKRRCPKTCTPGQEPTFDAGAVGNAIADLKT